MKGKRAESQEGPPRSVGVVAGRERRLPGSPVPPAGRSRAVTGRGKGDPSSVTPPRVLLRDRGQPPPAGPARGPGPSPVTPAARSHGRDGRKSGGDTRRGLRPPDTRTAACGALLPPAGPADSRQHTDRPPPAFQTAGEEVPVILSHQVMTICCGHPRKLVQGDTNF